MSTMIQIRNVPGVVHRQAKARAALEGLTLSEFALRALRREVGRPTMQEIAARIRAMEPVEPPVSAARLIREDRDSR
jgi:hypothetical protein